jgi:hypothetical protein
MSSDLERMLREARESLPFPDEEATSDARGRLLGRLRRSKRRTRTFVLIGATVVAAAVLGITAGSLNAPTGTAALEPAVLGFVPEPGWFALQSPPPAVPGQQTVAVAANVPFARDDTVHGLVEPSGLPYSTLLSLPPKGIVVVASMTPQAAVQLTPVLANAMYPKAELPLQVRDGVPYLQWGAQVRPDQPLAQYQLRAEIGRYDVDVVTYFGVSHPTEAQLDAAQRQLDGLVIRSLKRPQRTAAPAAPATPAVAVIDRTYACSTTFLGGLYELKNRAHAGIRGASGWLKLPYVVAGSGGWAAPVTGLPSAPSYSLAWITAGAPSDDTTVGGNGEVFSVRGGGTIGVNASVCRPSSAKVTLSSAGLRGGAVPKSWVAIDCTVSRRVLVRIRATVDGVDALRERARIFVATNAPARDAKLAVRTPAGKPLTYAEVSQTGAAKLFTAKGCMQG